MIVTSPTAVARAGMDSTPHARLTSGQALAIAHWDPLRRLLDLRSREGELSAIESRIADYVLEHGHRVRDQSSQQLADALGVSQSSVVKFAKRLGFRGYPDMKLSISEAIARKAVATAARAVESDPCVARAEALSQSKAAADDETRALNPPHALADVVQRIAAAQTMFLAGDGIDGLAIQSFATRMVLLGRRCMSLGSASSLRASLSAAMSGDVLVVAAERPDRGDWLEACRDMRAAGGSVVVVGRQRSQSLADIAHASLVVAAHAPQPHVADMLYEHALRQLFDDLVLRLHEELPDSAAVFDANHRRSRGGTAP